MAELFNQSTTAETLVDDKTEGTSHGHENKSKVTVSSTFKAKSFDHSKITNVKSIEEIEENKGTYRPVKSTNVVGDGILDILLETVRLNLDAQRKSGRIRQEEYAQAYVALTQAAIQAAVTLSLQGELAAKESALKDAMLAKEAEQIATYQRQRIAYDEDFLVKATQHLLDGYIAFLTSQPNVESQKFPAMYTTGGVKSGIAQKFGDNSGDEKTLTYMDGIMSRMYERINMYQSKQFKENSSAT